MRTLTLILIAAGIATAQPSNDFIRGLEAQRIERAAHVEVKGQKIWLASIAALAAANVVDAHSSWGKREANPLLAGADGRFGMKAAGFKIGISAGAIIAERFIFRRDRRAAAAVNFALSGTFLYVAKYNYGNARVK